MGHMRLLTVGRPRDGHMAALVDEYLRRINASWPIRWETVAEVPFRQGDEHHALRKEEERLLSRIAPQDFVVLLDVSGQLIDSSALAERLAQWRMAGPSVVLVIGGSLGTGEQVQARAQWRWSLSPLTLPHGLAQVVVAEQLYRAWTILQGHPYHK